MSQYTLYSYWRSSCAYRVRLCLHYKNLPYEYKAVNLGKGEQKDPAYAALYPNQTVPLLVVNGKDAIGQSLAIIEFLEETHPTPSIYPKDPVRRAQARTVALMIAADLQPLQGLGALKRITGKTEEKDVIPIARQVIADGFKKVEAMLQKTAGHYCVADDLSLADLFVVPQVINALKFGVDMAPYPIIQRIYNTCTALDLFKKTAPEVQPDFEKS